MPKMYTAIRDKFISQGMSEKEAKKHAALKIIAAHPDRPLIGYIQQEKRGGKK